MKKRLIDHMVGLVRKMLMKKKQSEDSMVMKKQSGRGEEGRFVMKTHSGGMEIDVKSKEGALLEWIEETLDSHEFKVTGSLFMLLTEMVAGDGWRIPLSYNRQSMLVDASLYAKDESTILTIISLLDSSPFLENLEILTPSLREYHLLHRVKNDDDFSRCVHWRLKTVTIDCYAGPDGKDNPLYAAIVLWLARIVLERAPALEKMSIVVKNYGDDCSEFVGILEQMYGYPRSSKGAQILILPDDPPLNLLLLPHLMFKNTLNILPDPPLSPLPLHLPLLPHMIFKNTLNILPDSPIPLPLLPHQMFRNTF